jgi:hypothetical protein
VRLCRQDRTVCRSHVHGAHASATGGAHHRRVPFGRLCARSANRRSATAHVLRAAYRQRHSRRDGYFGLLHAVAARNRAHGARARRRSPTRLRLASAAEAFFRSIPSPPMPLLVASVRFIPSFPRLCSEATSTSDSASWAG